MTKVLHVYPEMRSAGTEMVIMNLYRNVDRERIRFDFLVMREGESDGRLRDLGAVIHRLPKTKSYKKDLYDFFKAHPEYKIIHTHTHEEMGTVLKAAKRAGVPCRIAHSHNSRPDLPKIVKIYKMWTSRDIEACATHLIACSREAAEWLFPRRHKSAVIWNNAINLDAFRFDQQERVKCRAALGIPADAKVVAHVGRFADQKNHAFLIEVLNLLTKSDESVYALLVGDGPLFSEIRGRSESDRILFLGHRTDVPSILCAADVFLFPSNYEGLGIVAVEAQASGLFCLSSLGVPAAADIGAGVFERMDLALGVDAWRDRVAKLLDIADSEAREKVYESAVSSGYSIKEVAAEAQKFYLEFR